MGTTTLHEAWSARRVRMPGDDDAALDWLLFTQAGVVSWAQATAELAPARVRHLLATGRWERVCRGILRVGGGPVTPRPGTMGGGAGRRCRRRAGRSRGGPGGRAARTVASTQAVDVLIPYQRQAPDLLRRLPLGMPGGAGTAAPGTSRTTTGSGDDRTAPRWPGR